MYQSDNFDKSVVCKNYDIVKQNLKSMVHEIIENIIIDKPIFSIDDFDLYYYDDYVTNTNTNKVGDIRLYVEISQPKNIKTTTDVIQKKKKKNDNKIHLPELHYSLEKFKKEMFEYLVNIFDSNTTLWITKFDISMNHTEDIEGDGNYTSYKIHIIPCISYTKDDKTTGVIYANESGNEVEIEYPKLSIKNFEKKDKQTKGVYSSVIRIFKNLLMMKTDIYDLPSEIYEILLYNVPNENFVSTAPNDLLKVINYLRNADITKFKSMDEQDYAFISIYKSLSIFYAKRAPKLIEKQLKYVIKS